MTAPDTEIDPKNITDDRVEVKLEVKQVNQEYAKLIEKEHYIMRCYDGQYCPARTPEWDQDTRDRKRKSLIQVAKERGHYALSDYERETWKTVSRYPSP